MYCFEYVQVFLLNKKSGKGRRMGAASRAGREPSRPRAEPAASRAVREPSRAVRYSLNTVKMQYTAEYSTHFRLCLTVF